MSRRRRSTWKRLALTAFLLAGATGTVAVAHTAGALPAAALPSGGLSLWSLGLDMRPPGRMSEPQPVPQTETPAQGKSAITAFGSPKPGERCTRYVSLTLAAAHGIRQGRVEEAPGHMIVIGRLKGKAVRMTIAGVDDDCRVLRVETL